MKPRNDQSPNDANSDNARNSRSSLEPPDTSNDLPTHSQPQGINTPYSTSVPLQIRDRGNLHSIPQPHERRFGQHYNSHTHENQSVSRPNSDLQNHVTHSRHNSQIQDNRYSDISYTPTRGHSTGVRVVEVEIVQPDNDRHVREFDVSEAGPKFEEYESQLTRFRTFTSTNWSESYYVKPSDLARAGFFYNGPGDRVRCYFCGGFLRDWEPNDDPMVEHGRWFRNCGFLRLMRDGARVNL